MKMNFMIRYIVVGVIFLHATLMAQSHHRGMPRFTTPPDDDVFVRPGGVSPTAVFYCGRYHPAKRPAAADSNAFKRWVAIGKGKPPCGGKTIYLVQRQNVTPAAGTDSLTIEIQVRRQTNRIRVQSVQKLRLPSRSRNHHYVISSSVGGVVVEIHADKADRKTSQPKPKRKMKEQHNSRKRAAASRDAKGSSHRRCKVSHSKKESNHVRSRNVQ